MSAVVNQPPSNLLYIDFETYYSDDFSLSKMSEKSYVTDPRFKVHGCGIAVDDGPVLWLNGRETREFLTNAPIDQYNVVMHNAVFDAMVLTQHYGIRAKSWIDTLGMARAIVGTRLKSLGLDSLGQAFGFGGKQNQGKALLSTKGKLVLSDQELAALGSYCIDDVKLTRQLFKALASLFPAGEYPILSWTVDMAVNPRVLLDKAPLIQLEQEEKQAKLEAIRATGLTKTQLSSNQQFAAVLRSYGIEPPTKTSKTTGKQTYAFAKNDEDFLDLLDHPNDAVHDLITARLAVKSTIKETRAHTMLQLADNGPFPVLLKYSGAMQTHRLSGGGGSGSGVNVQNMTRGSLLRKSLIAPPGFKLVAADLSQIELRGNCLAAGQRDVLDVLANNGDVYINFAKTIYSDDSLNKKDNPQERTVGKIAELSLGYKSWAPTFKAMLRSQASIRTDIHEAERIVRLYRSTHSAIAQAWRIYQNWIEIMASGYAPMMDHPINLPIELKHDGFILPSGLMVSYPGIVKYNFDTQEVVDPTHVFPKEANVGYAYYNARRPGNYAKLHAGVLNNNLIQSVCRDVNFAATKTIIEGLPDIDTEASVVMSVHDETVVLAREDRAEAVLDFMLGVMKTPPSFWPDLPVDAEGSIGDNYRDVK